MDTITSEERAELLQAIIGSQSQARIRAIRQTVGIFCLVIVVIVALLAWVL